MARKPKDDNAKRTNGDGPTPKEAPATAGGSAPSTAGEGANARPQLNVVAQYVKDLSFESPGAPQTLQGPGENPQLKVGVNVNAGARGEDIYEVAVNIEAHAKSDVGVIYNAELVYAGVFRIVNVPQDMLQPIMFVDCPTILFPFVRRVLSDVVRDGGFPPLMLDPIDFARLYAQNMAGDQKAAQAQPN